MKTRALGFLLMAIGACTYAVGCGSSNNNNGTGGAGGAAGAGTGGKATGGVTGAGGVAGMGAGGKTDSGTDTSTDTKVDSGTDTGTDTKVDTGTDTPADTGTDVPADTSGDTQAAPTWTQVFAIISDKSTATSPGCTTCHDGVIADGGAQTLPHIMNFTDKAAAYAALVNADSIRCGATEAGAALKRVLPSNAAQSVLVQKLMQGMGTTAGICDTAAGGMPLNVSKPVDGGAVDGGDAGFALTTYMVTPAQLTTIQGWINAGALNN